MFGQQDDNQGDNQIPDQTINNVLNDGSQPTDGTPAPSTDDQQVTPQDQPAVDTTASDAWQHPGAPIDDSSIPTPAIVTPTEPISSPALTPDDTPPVPAEDTTPSNDTPAPGSDETPSDLVDLKQKALGQLSPLIGHLDQSPDEKFRTMMMMIQASDDQSLLNKAYEAAQAITDEKIKAQALLDIVNEINYFTQHHQS